MTGLSKGSRRPLRTNILYACMTGIPLVFIGLAVAPRCVGYILAFCSAFAFVYENVYKKLPQHFNDSEMRVAKRVCSLTYEFIVDIPRPTTTSPKIGVDLLRTDDSIGGLAVQSISPGSLIDAYNQSLPASRAADVVHVGDRILEADGQTGASQMLHELSREVASSDQRLCLRLSRESDRASPKIWQADIPASKKGSLGLRLTTQQFSHCQPVLVIGRVAPDSRVEFWNRVAKTGDALQYNDLLLACDGETDYTKILERLKKAQRVKLRVLRWHGDGPPVQLTQGSPYSRISASEHHGCDEQAQCKEVTAYDAMSGAAENAEKIAETEAMIPAKASVDMVGDPDAIKLARESTESEEFLAKTTERSDHPTDCEQEARVKVVPVHPFVGMYAWLGTAAWVLAVLASYHFLLIPIAAKYGHEPNGSLIRAVMFLPALVAYGRTVVDSMNGLLSIVKSQGLLKQRKPRASTWTLRSFCPKRDFEARLAARVESLRYEFVAELPHAVGNDMKVGLDVAPMKDLAGGLLVQGIVAGGLVDQFNANAESATDIVQVGDRIVEVNGVLGGLMLQKLGEDIVIKERLHLRVSRDGARASPKVCQVELKAENGSFGIRLLSTKFAHCPDCLTVGRVLPGVAGIYPGDLLVACGPEMDKDRIIKKLKKAESVKVTILRWNAAMAEKEKYE